MDEAEQIDKEEDSAGSLVRLNEEIQDQKKMQAKVREIVKTLKETGKENKKTPAKPFGKEEFSYDKKRDVYICPEGKILKNKGIAFGSEEKISYKAGGKECRECKHFGICTTSRNGRWVVRMVEQEELKERLEEIYHEEESQKLYKLRKEKAELPFGHMKRNLGAGQFLLRGKEGVNAELSILSTCFNMARMITIIGVPVLLAKFNSM